MQTAVKRSRKSGLRGELWIMLMNTLTWGRERPGAVRYVEVRLVRVTQLTSRSVISDSCNSRFSWSISRMQRMATEPHETSDEWVTNTERLRAAKIWLP